MGTFKRWPSPVPLNPFPWLAALQSLEPSKMTSGTRMTGFPPFDKSTVRVPLLPTTYCVQVRILKEKLRQECARSSLNTVCTDSVVEKLSGQGVYAYMLVFCGCTIIRHRSIIFLEPELTGEPMLVIRVTTFPFKIARPFEVTWRTWVRDCAQLVLFTR